MTCTISVFSDSKNKLSDYRLLVWTVYLSINTFQETNSNCTVVVVRPSRGGSHENAVLC